MSVQPETESALWTYVPKIKIELLHFTEIPYVGLPFMYFHLIISHCRHPIYASDQRRAIMPMLPVLSFQ